MHRGWMLVPFVLGTLACDGPAVVSDASVPTDAGATNVQIPWLANGAPEIAPPVFTPCPDGWREVAAADGPTTCDPAPEGGVPACGTFELFVPSAGRCELVGSSCPADGLPADAPATGAIFVLAAAAPGGDGTRAQPLARIADALAVATSGSVVAIGRGTYDEDLVVRSGITLLGACPEETVLVSSRMTDSSAVVTASGTGIVIRNLRIGASARWGVAVPPSSREARLENVIIEETRLIGATAAGSELALDHVLVRNVVPRSQGHLGYGVDVEIGGTATVTRSMFYGNHDGALFAAGAGSRIDATDVLVQRTTGEAIVVQREAGLTLERALLLESEEVGVSLVEGVNATMRDVVIRDVDPDPFGAVGRGIQVQGSLADVSRTLVEDVHELGIVASRDTTMLSLADVVVRDVALTDDAGSAGRGLQVQTGAHATAARLDFARLHGAGVVVLAASAVVEDLVVRSAAADERGAGRGVQIEQGGSLEVRRARLEDLVQQGAGSVDVGSSLLLEDVVVRNVSASPDGTYGIGIGAGFGATTTLRRVLVEDTRFFGLFLVGLEGGDPTSRVDAEDVVVRRTLPAVCTDCAGAPAGHGVATLWIPVTARRLRVEDADLCGLWLAREVPVSISDSVVARCSIGVCVQENPGFDPASLGGVRFEDNDTAFQNTSFSGVLPPGGLGALAE